MRTISLDKLETLKNKLLEIRQITGSYRGTTAEIDSSMFELNSIALLLITQIARELAVVEEYEESL